jgi:hypothetical protein
MIPPYPPAHAVAPRIEAHFARRGSGLEGTTVPAPAAADVERVIDAAFWASLRREEGFVPRISLALMPPSAAVRPLMFARPLPLDPETLTRMAPAVDRPGIHLGVWRGAGGLSVWGTLRSVPSFCFVLEVAAPGLLVVKDSRGEASGKFVNVAVLEGDRIKVLDERAARLPECPDLLASLLGFDKSIPSAESVGVLAQVAISMRSHGRGGLLLVVPTATERWRESILPHIPYPVSPPFAELSELLAAEGDWRQKPEWREAVRHSVDALAGLTAVDGATVITFSYELLAFGAKIMRRRGAAPVPAVATLEPVEGARPATVDPTQLGGTRHQSAAQFVHDQRDALALVASQDGRFTILAWSAADGQVHAYRVEALLL